jgi:hypothetical protein
MISLCRFFRRSASKAQLEPTPVFTGPITAKAGVRPWRDRNYRLENEPIAGRPDKYLIHNYGHGACGITLSWGCASQVADLVQKRVTATGDTEVAVLGSGVMGLTVATLVAADPRLKVTIYTKKPWDQTTSAVAAAQWAPTEAQYQNQTVAFTEALKLSYTRFKSQIGPVFGVSERPNYTVKKDAFLDLVETLLPGMMPARQRLNLPFANLSSQGYKYTTLLIETPIFLKKLHDDLQGRVPFLGGITTFQDVLDLPQKIVVNCTGLGWKQIRPDPLLRPVKGHLALLPAQTNLKYLFSTAGYLFPRQDAVIIGGTFCDDDSPTPDQAVSKTLVAHMRGVFGSGPKVDLPACPATFVSSDVPNA